MYPLKGLKMSKQVGRTIRERLIESGERGAVIADLHRDMKTRETQATYHSFSRYCWMFKKLGFIEPTTETEVAWSSTNWGENPKLHDRVYLRITNIGRDAPEHKWSNPNRTLYDLKHGDGAWMEYMKARKRPPTGRPRGRPRIADKKR